jgi:probable rRNA maturation factor
VNRVEISAEEVPLPPWTAGVNDYILKVLDRLNRDSWDLSVLFCSNPWIQKLNAQFRNKDEPTDVLSFVLGETASDDFDCRGRPWYLPGDIVISLETLAENARYFQVSEDEELRRLLIHGILHLDGMDHDTNEKDQPMLRLQETILAELSAEHILQAREAGVE